MVMTMDAEITLRKQNVDQAEINAAINQAKRNGWIVEYSLRGSA